MSSQKSWKTIIVETDGPVEKITLNRPRFRNALNSEMIEELYAYFSELSSRLEIRIVVLTGAESAFCSGLDLSQDSEGDKNIENTSVQYSLTIQRDIANIVMAMRRCPQPIISLVNGPACGGGFSLALASDIRIASKNARFNCAYIRIGLGGCDIGSSYFLPRLVGASLAAELILTGKFISAERALNLGLVARIVEAADLEKSAQEDIELMLTTNPLGLRLSKEALNMNIDAGGIEAAIALEDRNQILASRTKDFPEALSAFLSKRPPEFEDR